MKTLYLLRHAKSDWSVYPQISDFERGLIKRGKHDSKRLGKYMTIHHLLPKHIISSTAKRAVLTLKHVSKHLQYDGDIEMTDMLYEATHQTIQSVVEETSDAFGSVMIIGHNPGLSELLSMVDTRYIHIPTCGLVVMSCDIDSRKFFDVSLVTVSSLLFPKALKSGK